MPFNQLYCGPLLVTLAYMAVYYGAVINVARVKASLFREYQARGEKFDRYRTHDAQMLAADRIQLNMLEQMVPFVTLFWLTAVFASPTRATIYGALYVASRAVYPFVMGQQLGRNIRKRILFATMTGYLVIVVFMGELVFTLAV